MSRLAVTARIVLGVAFLVAAVAKGSDRTWPAAARRFGLARPVAIALPWCEAMLGALLTTGIGGRLSALVALGVIIGFSALLAARLARGDHTPCACFGAARARPLSGRSLLRNAVLAALAVVVLVA